MNQGWDVAAAGDKSEETVVAPRFDGRAEERARPVVPLGSDSERVSRVRRTSMRALRAAAAGPKSLRRRLFVVLPPLALLTVATKVDRHARLKSISPATEELLSCRGIR